MQQIIRAALKNPKDNTKISLIYANVTLTDILLKAELDALAESHPEQFKVYYVLNTPPEKWDGGVGFVNTDMIKERLPSPQPTSKVLLCGTSHPPYRLQWLLTRMNRSSSHVERDEEVVGRAQVRGSQDYLQAPRPSLLLLILS
jgi:NAD(P)H-flavin reductase